METNNLANILEPYRSAARNERDKFNYFKCLIYVSLQNDDIKKQLYSEIFPFSEWAKANGWKGNDNVKSFTRLRFARTLFVNETTTK